MNKKDEEAFNAWVISEDNSEGLFSNMNSYTRDEYFAKAGFEAGAKHGRSQLNELRDDNMSELYEVIKKLQEEIDELTSILDLKKETIVEMQNAYETLNAHDEMLIATVDKLKEENKKLVEALKIGVEAGEFFARHADCRRDSWSCKCSFCKDTSSSSNLRKARQVLKEIGEE